MEIQYYSELVPPGDYTKERISIAIFMIPL